MHKKHVVRLLVYGVIAVYGIYLYAKDDTFLPPLQDGDIVLQSTPDPQAIAIALATMSPYTHTGIIKLTDKGVAVIQAADIVRETPLKQWIRQGVFSRFSVYRHQGLTPEQGKRVVTAAWNYYGKHYDIFFSFANDQIYCSELPYLSYRDTGISVGKVQKIKELHVNNSFARELIEERWEHHPKCVGKKMTFEECYDVIMNDELVSPASIADDPHFARIFTNYF